MPRGYGGVGYERFWLPESIAKGGSAGWVYVPGSVRAEAAAYADFDRTELVAEAQPRYRRVRRPLFTAFKRLRPATEFEGTGIGLDILARPGGRSGWYWSRYRLPGVGRAVG